MLAQYLLDLSKVQELGGGLIPHRHIILQVLLQLLHLLLVHLHHLVYLLGYLSLQLLEHLIPLDRKLLELIAIELFYLLGFDFVLFFHVYENGVLSSLPNILNQVQLYLSIIIIIILSMYQPRLVEVIAINNYKIKRVRTCK